jgi:hypothetical protein
MREEGDFAAIDPLFLSTSQAGEAGPQIDGEPAKAVPIPKKFTLRFVPKAGTAFG